MSTITPRPMSAAELAALVTDARLFAAELDRWQRCETADAETDTDKRTALRKRIVGDGFVWCPVEPSRQEIDLLYGMAREACRIALARRSAVFRSKYRIDLTCGDAPAEEASA